MQIMKRAKTVRDALGVHCNDKSRGITQSGEKH